MWWIFLIVGLWLDNFDDNIAKVPELMIVGKKYICDNTFDYDIYYALVH